jgi:uncharacterized protein
MTKKAQPFSVMIKPVGSHCNLRCGYCYYREKTRSSPDVKKERMTEELLERFIYQYIEASSGPELSFVWHGGEPTLAGLDFYQRAVDLQKQYLPDGWTCWNNLQTNGVLIDDEWCEFLAEAGFDVGLSVDGTPGLHDRYRKDQHGKGSYLAAAEAAHRLLAHGVRPDLLCTVTSDTAADPLGTYRALRDFDTGWIQFIPIVRRNASGKVTADSVSSADYGTFLTTVFDEWALGDLGRLEVQMFAEMARIQAGGGAGLCWMAPTCGRALIVEADGSVYSCDHFVFDEYRIGDIISSHLAELADSSVQLNFGVEKHASLPKQCRDCTWLVFCNGGCPKDRFIQSVEGEQGLNYLCDGLLHFFAYSSLMINEIARLRLAGAASNTIMARMRELAEARWRGVGRNDPCPCGSGKKAKNCCWLRRL